MVKIILLPCLKGHDLISEYLEVFDFFHQKIHSDIGPWPYKIHDLKMIQKDSKGDVDTCTCYDI